MSGKADEDILCQRNESTLSDKICHLGEKFAIMYRLWMANTQLAFQTQLNPKYMPMDQLNEGAEWRCQAEHVDLRKVFPGKLHIDLGGNFIYPIIFNYSAQLFVQLDWRFANCQVLIGWTEGPGSQAYYNPFAPILYCDYQGHQDINNIFLNPRLFDIFNVIIHGPGTLDHKPGKSGLVTMDTLWDLTEVTPGAIVASAIYSQSNI
ncbi:hypothetical protein K439DRAFT_1621235 [Ramaria rubella]|nr:hypothetical protein K439DRAFT_1621235 [Ramaria rubella]